MAFVNFLVALLCVTCIKMSAAQPEYEENRSRLLRFLSVVSGFTSLEISQNGRLIPESKIAIPIETSAFGTSLAYLYQEIIGSALIIIRNLMVLYKGEDGTIRITPYNFTGYKGVPIDELDLSIFLMMNISDYYTTNNCGLVITEVEMGVYMGNWPHCEIMNELNPTFATLWTCNSVGFISCKDLECNTGNKNPIIYQKSRRFPLLPSMYEGVEDFVDPC